LLSGNAATVLNEPFSIILTQSTAKALFGNEDPVGKVLRIDNAHDVKVAGLMDNEPDNSTLQFSYLLPFKLLGANRTVGKGSQDGLDTLSL